MSLRNHESSMFEGWHNSSRRRNNVSDSQICMFFFQTGNHVLHFWLTGVSGMKQLHSQKHGYFVSSKIRQGIYTSFKKTPMQNEVMRAVSPGSCFLRATIIVIVITLNESDNALIVLSSIILYSGNTVTGVYWTLVERLWNALLLA